MFGWSENSFRQLGVLKQYKELALLLRKIYENHLQQVNDRHVIDLYKRYCMWMEESPVNFHFFEEIADAYHLYLRKAQQSLKEGGYLPSIPHHKDKLLPVRKAWDIDIYLDKLRSCHNIGSIFRTCEALRLGRIVSKDEWQNLEHPQVKKTSMGCFEWVEWKRIDNIHQLKRPILLLETEENSQNLYTYNFPKSFTLVLGNEEYGVSGNLKKYADKKLHIPMVGKKNSLNVANAFSIVAGEIVRQRLGTHYE